MGIDTDSVRSGGALPHAPPAAPRSGRVRRWLLRALIVGVPIVIVGGIAAPRLLGVRALHGERPRTPPRTYARLEALWDAILRDAVRDGVVDYALLARRREPLAELVGALAELGPETVPSAFPDRSARLAYYINAYNILVVYAVVEERVRRSVHDVRGLLSPIPGMGFFWALRFDVDGRRVHLHGLENDILRAQFDDARLHAAINCASASCPRLAEHAYHGATLDAELASAARRFASDAPHVRVDDARREVVLSAIYDWYTSDFARHARALGAEPSVLGWIAQHADTTMRAAIERARAGRYRVRYAPYDWRLNGHWREASGQASR